ncbi:uncharacterized protein LOC120750012 [Hirundo rustica]|uniref:uncharacterized protein LOC120750012 n=1 Tax=Hirundo rustica TaxID=43150 RepID=UPI002672B4BB|nr:uncharacterized protein LOC120750012 [Hirundo rustica]
MQRMPQKLQELQSWNMIPTSHSSGGAQISEKSREAELEEALRSSVTTSRLQVNHSVHEELQVCSSCCLIIVDPLPGNFNHHQVLGWDICLKQKHKPITRREVQLSGLVSDTGDANLWQKTSCCPQHLLCPSSSHETLIWVELWREAEAVQGSGSCWEGARGRSLPTQRSSNLHLLPFCSILTAVTKAPLFPALPGFCPTPPRPRQGRTLVPQPGAAPLEAESAPWIQDSTAGDPPLWGCAAVTPSIINLDNRTEPQPATLALYSSTLCLFLQCF